MFSLRTCRLILSLSALLCTSVSAQRKPLFTSPLPTGVGEYEIDRQAAEVNRFAGGIESLHQHDGRDRGDRGHPRHGAAL